MNGDGLPDVICGVAPQTLDAPARIAFIVNSGERGYAPPLPVLSSPGRPHGLAAADLNGDGRPDVIAAGPDVSDPTRGWLSVWLAMP